MRATFLIAFLTIISLRAYTGNNNNNSDSYCNSLNVAVIGDSMSWIGGEDCENPKGWTYDFKKSIRPDSIIIYARSGATWTNDSLTSVSPDAYTEVTHPDNVLYNQVIRLKRDLEQNKVTPPQLVIMFAGANDAWFEDKRPGCLDTTILDIQKVNPDDLPSSHTNMAESIALCVDIIRRILPSARIALVTPLENAKTPVEKTRIAAHIIENTAKECGCDIIDARTKVKITHNGELSRRKYTSDGVHTNPEGASIIAEVISDYVRNLDLNNNRD